MFSVSKNIPAWLLAHLNKKTLINTALTLTVLIALWLYRAELLSVITLLGDREGLIQEIEEYGALGSIVLSAVLVLQVIIAALPGHLLIMAGGYLFGFLKGFVITHISIVISSQICYLLARKYGRPVIERLAPTEDLEKWTQRTKQQGITFFIISFNLPFFPNDLMNYVAGLSGISSRKFFIANILGKLPTSLIFTLIGSHGMDFSWQFIAITFTLALIIVGFWQFIGPEVEERYFAKRSA